VKDRQQVEEWADALLDQHRSAPREDPGAGGGATSWADEHHPMVRLASRISGEPPDPEMLKRLGRKEAQWQARYGAIARLEPVMTFIGIAVTCVLAYAFYSVL
jgi:hypothetical protein